MMIKKIMSVIASAVMIGSTVMFASAVGTTNTFGANTNIDAPGSLDLPAANIMSDYINSLDISQTNQTIIEGEYSEVKTSSQPLYLGDIMSETKATFTDDQLPNVLASGEVEGDDGTDYDYNLKIDVPNSKIRYGEPEDNIDKAIVYADFSGDQTYKLRIIFPTAVNVKELAGESIKLFGKDFTFSEDKDDLDADSIILFEKSNSVKINNGETIVVDGHNIRADIEDGDSATIYVDGVSKNVDDDDWSGKINGVDIYVKDIFAPNIDGGSRYVQISLNAEKITLADGDEVELGSSSIDGTNVEIKSSGDKVSEIAITITPNDIEDEDGDNIEYLGDGKYLIDPIFKTIKFSLDSVNPDLKSDDRDEISIKTSGDKDAVLKFTNKAGKEYNFNLIENKHLNYKKQGVSEDEYFITGNNEYTQIWKVERINDDEVRLKDQGSDSSSVTLSLDDSDNAELTLADGSSVRITAYGDYINLTDGKTIDYLYTENGAQIVFDFGIEYTYGENEVCDVYPEGTINQSSCHIESICTSGPGNCGPGINWTNQTVCDVYPINTANPNSCHMEPGDITTTVNKAQIIIKEETPYNGGDFTDNKNANLGKEIVVSINNIDNDDDLEVSVDGSDYSDDDYKYSVTRYGTYIKQTDEDKVELYYPESAMEINFNIGETSFEITSSPIDGQVSKIIFGGSCINSEAARLLGVPFGTCGSEFTNLTGIQPDQALIKTFAEADGKIAILVAGYEVQDTLRASNYLKNNYQSMDLTPGSQVII